MSTGQTETAKPAEFRSLFEEPAVSYPCLYECGQSVSRAGYACPDCSEKALPFELQKREDDHFLLIRHRELKYGDNKGQERWIVLRPKHQDEKNTLEGAKALKVAAEHIHENFSFAKSAEGKEFWEGIYNMMLEKSHEMAVAAKKKK